MTAKYFKIANADLHQQLQGPTITYLPESGGIFDIKVYARLEYRPAGAVSDLTDIEDVRLRLTQRENLMALSQNSFLC